MITSKDYEETHKALDEPDPGYSKEYKFQSYWQGFNCSDGTRIELDYCSGQIRRVKQ